MRRDGEYAGMILDIGKGCGRASILRQSRGVPAGLMTIGRIGNLIGALKVEHPGTQNQRFDYDEFSEQFRQQFGYAL